MTAKPYILKDLKAGAVSGFPIVLGYFPVAIAFGLLAKNTHVSLRDSSFLSLFVFAGASQFMALDLIKAGVTAGNIILATFLLNLRHLMMSASLSVKLKNIKKYWLPFIAFGVTDETFSVTSLGNENLSVPFLLALHTVSYTSWVLGSIVGYLAGSILPSAVQSSLGIGLYALFTALLVPEIKKSLSVLFLALLSGMIYAIISYFKLLPASWSLVAAIIAASLAGVFFIKEEEQKA